MTHEWTIQGVNATFLLDYPNRMVVNGTPFSVGDVMCRLVLYLNGDGEEDKGHVSMFLAMMTPDKYMREF